MDTMLAAIHRLFKVGWLAAYAEGVALPIYEQIRARITPRVTVGAEASL